MKGMAMAFTTALLAVALHAPEANSGGLLRLDMRWVGTAPAGFPVPIEIKVFEKTNTLKGQASADFDGASLSNLACDAVVCITDAFLDEGSLVVRYTVNGYKPDGRFAANSSFEVIVDGVSSKLALHTSCSQILFIEAPYPGNPSGEFFIEAGDGTCFQEGDCPPINKIFSLDGFFRVPLTCALPAQVTFKVYEKSNKLKGTSTGTFDGTSLSGVACDDVACLTGASLDGGVVVVAFESSGYKAGGKFGSSTTFELSIEGCPTWRLEQLHTSCSRPVLIGPPYDTSPSGSLVFTNGCGGDCLIFEEVPVEESNWGEIKAIYR